MGKRLLVCGGRDFGDLLSITREHPLWDKRKKEYQFVHRILDELTILQQTDDPSTWLPENGTFIIQGGAKGADAAAHDWAVVNWVPQDEYPADWKKHGRRAGFLRNLEMLEKGKPDLVVAFPGGRGTSMMIELAKNAGVPVKQIEYTDG